MVPKETSFIKRLVMDLFFATSRLPPHSVQRMPTIVRFIIILSRSSNAISNAKLQRINPFQNKRDECCWLGMKDAGFGRRTVIALINNQDGFIPSTLKSSSLYNLPTGILIPSIEISVGKTSSTWLIFTE